jgi:hypothetical protein
VRRGAIASSALVALRLGGRGGPRRRKYSLLREQYGIYATLIGSREHNSSLLLVKVNRNPAAPIAARTKRQCELLVDLPVLDVADKLGVLISRGPERWFSAQVILRLPRHGLTFSLFWRRTE